MKVRSLLAYSSPRWLAFFMALALGLCLPCSSLSADAGTTAVSVSAPSQPVASGQQFTISILVVPNTALSGLQFNLHFDPALVSIDSIEEGTLLGQNGATTYFNPGQIDNQEGTLTGAFGVITSPGQTVSTQGTLAIIRLTANAQTGACPLGLSNVVAGDINGNSVPVSGRGCRCPGGGTGIQLVGPERHIGTGAHGHWRYHRRHSAAPALSVQSSGKGSPRPQGLESLFERSG